MHPIPIAETSKSRSFLVFIELAPFNLPPAKQAFPNLKLLNGLHFIRLQIKVQYRDVFLHMLRTDALGDHDDPLLGQETQGNLGNTLSVITGNFYQCPILPDYVLSAGKR